MKNIVYIVIIGLVICTADFASADEPQPPRKREFREGRRGPGDREGRRPRQRRMRTVEERLDLLTTELELDKDQRIKIEGYLTEYQENLKTIRADMRSTEEETNEMQEIRKLMREGRELGDESKIEEARERMKAFRDKRQERIGPSLEAQSKQEEVLRSKVSEELRPDQKSKLDGVWDQIVETNRRGPGAGGVDPRQLRQITNDLEGLSVSQKKQIDELFEGFRQKQREDRRDRRGSDEAEDLKDDKKSEKNADRPGRRGRNGDRQGRDEFMNKLVDDIRKILNEEQVKEFDKHLERAKEEGRGRRGPRPDGQGRGGQKGPPSDEE